MQVKHTLVLGASENTERYANKAVRSLLEHGHLVTAVGKRVGSINGTPIHTSIPSTVVFDTVTIYLGERNQEQWEQRILEIAPKRIIFNPGAENPDFAHKAEEQGIEVLEACTLVMLGTGQY
ncbi:MAG: CoA-binding protein [Flavobacteriales bacterium]|nr:CoA-binding protein [Flavobacteriales bacterium]